MTILSIGDQVRPGRYRLHSRFRHVANFTDGKRLVSLVTEDIGPGPLNIVVRDLPGALLREMPRNPLSCHPERSEGSPRRGQRDSSPRRQTAGTRNDIGVDCCGTDHSGSHILRVGRYSVFLANRRWDVKGAQSYASPLHLPKETSGAHFRKNLKLFEKCLSREAHAKSLAFLMDPARLTHFRTGFERALAERIAIGTGKVSASVAGLREAGCKKATRPGSRRPGSATPATAGRDIVEGVRLIAGCGFGLTASGDDYLAGVLVALNVLGRAPHGGTRQRRVPSPGLRNTIAAAARSENPLTCAFLNLARRGRVNPNQQALVTAILTGAPRDVRAATQAVLAMGATSGADFATGFLLTLRSGMNPRS